MNTITVKDGTEIYYKNWGTGQPLFFHGWPLSADDCPNHDSVTRKPKKTIHLWELAVKS